MKELKNYLTRLLDNLSSAHAEWSQDESQGLAIEGKFWLALDEVLEVYCEQDNGIPPGMIGVFNATRDIQPHWVSYKAKATISGDSTMVPGAQFWKLYEMIYGALEQSVPIKAKLLESIEQFDREKLPDRLIAKAYSWFLPDGITADLERVRLARQSAAEGNPVLVYSDSHLRQAEEIVKKKTKRKAAPVKLRAKKEKVKAPESLSTLVTQKVPLKQISEILSLSETEVLAKCQDQGLYMAEATSVYSERGTYTPELSETEDRRIDASAAVHLGEDSTIDHESLFEDDDVKEVPDVRSLEQQVIDAHDDGGLNTDIAEALGLSRQKVQSIIKRRSEVEAVA